MELSRRRRPWPASRTGSGTSPATARGSTCSRRTSPSRGPAREAYLAAQGHTGPMPPAAYLAISGGGDNGAFGAGLLDGWTKAGTRPTFKLVTGVSTGALIAPFAFLGPAYDEQLEGHVHRRLHEGHRRAAVGSSRFSTATRWPTRRPSGISSRNPSRRRCSTPSRPSTRRGASSSSGPRTWTPGARSSGTSPRSRRCRRPGALELVQKILLASAAIPGTFPPVMIDVESDGQVLRRDARRRRDGHAGLRLSGRHAPEGSLRRARRRARAHALRHPQRAPRSGMGGGGPPDPADRAAGHRLPHPVPGHRRPVPHLLDHAARRRRLQPRVHPRDVPGPAHRRTSIPRTWDSSSTSDTRWARRASRGPSTRRSWFPSTATATASPTRPTRPILRALPLSVPLAVGGRDGLAAVEADERRTK